MSLTALQLFTYYKLPKIGNVSVLALGKKAQEKNISLHNQTDLLNFINKCIDEKVVTGGAKKFSINDIIEAENYAKYIWEKSQNLGIKIISYFDNIYPNSLRCIVKSNGKNDSPAFLHLKGNIEQLQNLYNIAIIGTREPTPEGEKAGLLFSELFAKEGFNIISGLAIGCDSTAHIGALKAKGITTAFLAGGLDKPIYPKENIQLANEIIENNGLLISEYELGTPYMANRFVERDRLQSGLADATMVIQTGEKGGTMHAVNATIINKKLLYVVQYKGSVLTCEKVQGNIKLLNEKYAKPLTSVNCPEIIQELKESINKRKLTEDKNEQNFEDGNKSNSKIIEQKLFDNI